MGTVATADGTPGPRFGLGVPPCLITRSALKSACETGRSERDERTGNLRSTTEGLEVRVELPPHDVPTKATDEAGVAASKGRQGIGAPRHRQPRPPTRRRQRLRLRLRSSDSLQKDARPLRRRPDRVAANRPYTRSPNVQLGVAIEPRSARRRDSIAAAGQFARLRWRAADRVKSRLPVGRELRNRATSTL